MFYADMVADLGWPGTPVAKNWVNAYAVNTRYLQRLPPALRCAGGNHDDGIARQPSKF